MTEVLRIAGLLKDGYEGEPWYGTSFSKLLADVTAEKAASHPINGAHSIWQEVLHVIADRRVVCRRLEGETVDGVSEEDNWSEPQKTDATAWQQTLDELARTQTALLAALNRLTDDRLQEEAPGKPYSLYVMLHGVIHHDAYHAGQIAIVRNQVR